MTILGFSLRRLVGAVSAGLLAFGSGLSVTAVADEVSIDSPYKGVYTGDVKDGATNVGAFLLIVRPSGEGRLIAMDRVARKALEAEVAVVGDGTFTTGTGAEAASGAIALDTGAVTGSAFGNRTLAGAKRERGPYASYVGYWEGTYKLAGSERADGRMRIIVGADGRVGIHVRAFAEDGLRAGGTGTLNTLGAFSVTLDNGSLTFTGTIELVRKRFANGVFTNSANAAQTGTFTARREFLPGENFRDGGWRWTRWFGNYMPEDSGWVFHEDHGWVFASGDEDRLFLYDRQFGWLFTNKRTYPWVYSYERSRWLYTGKRPDGTRTFFDGLERRWIDGGRGGKG
jgi:hypothetical protein